MATKNRVKKLFIKPPGILYSDWVKDIEPLYIASSTKHKLRPLITVVVPLYNTPEKYLKPLIESVINQTYRKWELCLVDGSTDLEKSAIIARYAKMDKRIKLIVVGQNLGISKNTNIGIKAAAGDFIAFMDHDDTLAPFALNEVVAAYNKHPDTDLFYSDEDKLSDDGSMRGLPFFKPDWSPELLLGINYMAHFVVVKTSLARKVGGLRLKYDGSQDFDFLLRVIDTKPNIHHIPKVLYHWRMAEGSTARSVGTKSYADDAGQNALKDYLKRNKIAADVLPVKDRPTNYRLKYKTTGNPKVSIIIPFKDKVELLRVCVGSILAKTTYKNFEIILVSNASQEIKTFNYLKKIKTNRKVKVVEDNRPFNYSAVNNFGRKYAKGDLLLFLNNDMKVINKDWLEELVGVAIQPQIGAVGGWLFYPDGKVQHAGVTVGMTGSAGHPFRMLKPGSFTAYGLPDWPRNYLAVTGACLMVKARVFDQVGGFDERFTICGSDVALCLSIFEAGYRNVFWPYAKLYHYESQSVGSYQNIPITDWNLSMECYKPYMENGDPYFNPNLDYLSEQIAIRGKK